MIAIALISGGLDSLLAAKLIKDQGIEVIGLHYHIPFCKVRISRAFRDIGIKLEEIDLSADFLKILQKPRYGFGSQMNPCIDCKILMLRKTKELMPKYGAKFIVTGEVLGQRPMSQNKQTLEIIRNESEAGDLLLRPLSALYFPPSLAEREGWVRRDRLLSFNGRRRRPQMELAESLGIKEYSTPAGGCLLTDKEFSRRLKELIAHQEMDLDNLELLKTGRHFRVGEKTKLVVGRDARENNKLLELAKPGDYLFSTSEQVAGPVSLARGMFDTELACLCSRITSSYSDLKLGEETDISCRRFPAEKIRIEKITVLPREKFIGMRV